MITVASLVSSFNTIVNGLNKTFKFKAMNAKSVKRAPARKKKAVKKKAK
ncbi:MAG TPA: hypothetical protein VNJ08_04225 [Bacteriovoracaceae bacterium]|nr:hypothetical protein [Bacteriovoracaceae bacterium]